MAKTKNDTDEAVSIEFARTGNPWIDAGVVGLYRVLSNRTPYIDRSDGAGDLLTPEGVEFELFADHLSVTGPRPGVQRLLENAYDRLVSTYFNVSSKKQKEDEIKLELLFRFRAGRVRQVSQEESGRRGVAAVRQGGQAFGHSGGLGERGRRQEGTRPAAAFARPPSRKAQ